jgi:hypothetical protein
MSAYDCCNGEFRSMSNPYYETPISVDQVIEIIHDIFNQDEDQVAIAL